MLKSMSEGNEMTYSLNAKCMIKESRQILPNIPTEIRRKLEWIFDPKSNPIDAIISKVPIV